MNANVGINQEPASKYLIIEKQWPYTETTSSRQGYSSYESPYLLEKSTHEKYSPDEEEEEQPREVVIEPMRIGKPMEQTRVDEPKVQKEELFYSESEEDSMYA